MDGILQQRLDLRIAEGTPLFRVTNSHVQIDSKFVIDNLQQTILAKFGIDLDNGEEKQVPEEAVIDLGEGDIAYFQHTALRIFSPSLERANSKLEELIKTYGLPEVPAKAVLETIKPDMHGTYSSRTIKFKKMHAQSEEELALHYGAKFLSLE
jgi:hypothetical protein